MGKDTIQNIFSLRFSNTIFEGIWNKNFIDHVQIVALEKVWWAKRRRKIVRRDNGKVVEFEEVKYGRWWKVL